jgi:O-antigen ligase/tetratricopeptide (TPR) repeat protein
MPDAKLTLAKCARPRAAATNAVALPPRSLWETVGLGLLLVYLALAPVLFSTATLGAFEFPKVTLLSLTAILLVALGLCAALRPRPAPANGVASRREGLRNLWRRPLALGVLLILLSAVASTAASLSPLTSLLGVHESHAGLVTVAGYTVLFFAARGLCRSYRDARLLLTGGVLAAAVAAAYALLQFARFDPIPWAGLSGVGAYVRPFGPLGHPNFLAAHLVMTLPLTLYLARRAAAAGRRLACVALALLALACCAAIAVSMSRGAWLALACVLLVLALGAVAARQWRTAALTVGLPVGGAALLLGLACIAGEETLLQALRQRVEGLTESSSRQHIWDAGLAIFRDHPWLGSGLDTFQLAFGLKRTTAYWQVEWDVTPTRAHNEALHVLVTQGVVGAAALLVLLFGLGVAAVRAWRRAPAEARPLVLAVSAGAVGFLVTGAFGFTVAACGGLFATFAGLLARLGEAEIEAAPEGSAARGLWFPIGLAAAVVLVGGVITLNFCSEADADPQVLAVAGAVLGVSLLLTTWAVIESRKTEDGRKKKEGGFSVFLPSSVLRLPSSVFHPWRRLAAAAVWAGAVAVIAIGIIRPLQANVLCCAGERLLNTHPRDAVQEVACAVLLDPLKELHWTKLAAVAEATAGKVPLREERRELFLMARTALERATRLSPLNAYHHANLGKVLGKMARAGFATTGDAYAAFDRALELDGQNVNFYADAAFAALGVEDLARARRYAARGTELCPRYAPTRAYLGYLALREGRNTEATTLLCEANADEWHDRASERPLALANLGTAYLKLRLFEHSADASRQALALAPRLAEARCNLAVALEQLGRSEEAAEAYAQTLQCIPGHPKAREGLDRLGARGMATE